VPLRILAQAVVLAVVDDTDDLDRGTGDAGGSEALSNGILARPESVREGLVDHRHLTGQRTVLLGEFPAPRRPHTAASRRSQ
jgi:hypothetical protein